MGWTPAVQVVRPKGRAPYYRVKVGGKQRYLGTDAAEAFHKADQILKESGHIEPGGEREPEYVADLIRLWRLQHTSNFYEVVTSYWLEWAGQTHITEIEVDHLERFFRYLESVRYSPGGPNVKERTTPRRLSAWSIQKYVRYPWSILKWANAKGWLDRVPLLPRLPQPTKQPRDVRPDDLVKAFADLPAKSGRILRFIVETGCRPSEACNLQWEDVDMERAVCVLSQHKTHHRGRVRTLYLNPVALAILEECPKHRRQGLVFVNGHGKCYTASGLRTVLRRKGIRGAYQLRHTFAQNALEQGVALEDVAKLLGHADLRTVQTYAQVRDHRARSVAASLVSALPALRPTSGNSSIAAETTKSPTIQQAQTRAIA